MSIDDNKSSSRRSLLAGAAVGVGALAATAVGRPVPARADDGQAVLQGVFNTSQSTTTVAINSATSNDAFVGAANNNGTGLWGSSPGGSGVKATTTSGYALQTLGRLNIGTSGIATIPGGATSFTVSPGVDITTASFVLLTARSNLGGRDLWVVMDESANTFRIRMSSSRAGATKVGWLLLG
jgi:hypothetical protein